MSAELLRALFEYLSTDKTFCDPISSIPRDMDIFHAVKDSGYDSNRATGQTLPHPERHSINHFPGPQDRVIAGTPTVSGQELTAAA